MKKWFLLTLVLVMSAMLLAASAETVPVEGKGENIIDVDGGVVEVTEVELDPGENIVDEGGNETEEGYTEVTEDVDLDEEEDEVEVDEGYTEVDEDYTEVDEDYTEVDEDYVEAEDVDLIEYIDLDEGSYSFPEVYCEVLEDTFELSEPVEGAQIVGGHYQGDLLWVVDIVGDYWLLPDGHYISADAVQIYNEDEIPGESEAKKRMNPRSPFDVKLVLCDPASEIEDIAEKYHSVIIVDTVDKKLHVFKYGVETLEVSLVPLNELSPLYSYWSIDEDFLQEDAYAIGWDEVVAKVFAYSLPGSYMVIFQ